MKPKYEMKQMVAYWNGEIGIGADVVASEVCEIHQIDDGVEYKLKEVVDMKDLLEEWTLHEDLESLKEAIRAESERLIDKMFIDCEAKFKATQGNTR